MKDWDGFGQDNDINQQEQSRYLIFRLGGEFFGTPLLGVREVIEPQKFKPVPNTVAYFLGLINIRGQVIGLTDLRLKLGISTKDIKSSALLVFETEAGPVATIADSVEAVQNLADQEIHKNPAIRSPVSTEYLLGIGKFNGQMVTLIDLNKCFSADDFVQVQSKKLVG
jgi:purine-binding chemotaxis protein CheW